MFWKADDEYAETCILFLDCFKLGIIQYRYCIIRVLIMLCVFVLHVLKPESETILYLSSLQL